MIGLTILEHETSGVRKFKTLAIPKVDTGIRMCS